MSSGHSALTCVYVCILVKRNRLKLIRSSTGGLSSEAEGESCGHLSFTREVAADIWKVAGVCVCACRDEQCIRRSIHSCLGNQRRPEESQRETQLKATAPQPIPSAVRVSERFDVSYSLQSQKLLLSQPRVSHQGALSI